MRGTRRPGVGEHELRAVTDHPAPLEILARVEAGCVDERDDRKVERIAERDEPGRLLGRRDVERAGERDRLVRHDADRTSVDRRERGDDVRRPAVAELEQAVLVDDRLGDLADVVAAGRRRRDLGARFGARPIGRIVARPAGRLDVGAVGEVVQQVLHRLDGGVAIGDDHRRHAGVAGMGRRSAELVDVDADAGELLDHHRPVDERVARLGHDREVGEPEQQGRPRDRWTVDDDDRRHPARTARQRRCDASPRVQRRHALDDVGTGARQHEDDGQADVAPGGQTALDLGRRRRRQVHHLTGLSRRRSR